MTDDHPDTQRVLRYRDEAHVLTKERDDLHDEVERMRVAMVASGAFMLNDHGELVAGDGWPCADTVSCAFCGDPYCSGGMACPVLDDLTIHTAEAKRREVMEPAYEQWSKERRRARAERDAWKVYAQHRTCLGCDKCDAARELLESKEMT